MLAATVNATEPFPDPLAPAPSVIQFDPLVAVQPQPLPLLTTTVLLPVPPDAANDVGLVETVNEHGVVPACEIETVRPATVSVPARVDAVVFGITEKSTDPLPEPAVVLVATTIHDGLAVATQSQPAPVVTDADPLPPVDPKVWEAGASA